MPDYTVYSGTTGAYVKSVTAPDQTQAELNVEPGDILVAGDQDEGTWYDNGVVLSLPPKPEEWLVWDGAAWVDPRTQADYDTALNDARQAASRDIYAVAFDAAEDGLFGVPATIIGQIANNPEQLPDVVIAFLNALPTDARNYTLGGMRIMPTERMHPRVTGPTHPDDPGDGIISLIPWLESEHGIVITPAQLDELFGVQVPPPLYTA